MGFSIGSAEIRLYGLLVGIGFVTAFLIGAHLYKKSGYKEMLPYLMLAVVAPAGIFGARLFFVIFADGHVPFFGFGDGGLVIYGGVIVALLAVIAVALVKRVGVFTLTDAIVVGLIIAQAIGRWGNFTNILGGYYEGYGSEVGNHVPPFTNMVHGAPHLAFWLFESILNFIGFFLLWRIFKKQTKWGTTTAAYFIYYGIVRAILEPMRGDVLTLFGDSTFFMNRLSFVISIGMIILGGVILYLNKLGKINQENIPLLEEKGGE